MNQRREEEMMTFIMVYNLNRGDFERKKNIEEIEKAISKALGKDEPKFSFPQDPTVTSDNIMVIIIVKTQFDGLRKSSKFRIGLAKNIGRAFLSVPGNEKRSVAVAIEELKPKNGYWFARRDEALIP